MVYFTDAQTYLQQSTLLIEARPTTTKISTKYSLPSTKPSKKRKRDQPEPATLTVKTYDPVSGTCLKYKTDKGAEVGRLVGILGKCARVMAALPAETEGASLTAGEAVGSDVQMVGTEESAAAEATKEKEKTQVQQQGKQGGGKKKKKR